MYPVACSSPGASTSRADRRRLGVPGITIERWGSLLLAGAVFGLANIVLKPLLTFIAIPLIILTFGIAYFFVNVAILAFTEWVVPNFSIDGFWTYVGAVIVMWLVNVALGRLLRAIEGDVQENGAPARHNARAAAQPSSTSERPGRDLVAGLRRGRR